MLAIINGALFRILRIFLGFLLIRNWIVIAKERKDLRRMQNPSRERRTKKRKYIDQDHFVAKIVLRPLSSAMFIDSIPILVAAANPCFNTAAGLAVGANALRGSKIKAAAKYF